MAQIPKPLAPDPGERGLASTEGTGLAKTALAAWSRFIDIAAECDLDHPSRARQLSGAQALLAFGDWPENRSLHQILADAHAGLEGTVDQAQDARLALENHGHVTPGEALDAVRRSRDQLASWIEAGGPSDDGMLPTRSLLGTLPVLTLVHATAFQLAVTARDLEPCGARVDPLLLSTGLHALVDTTGALAARQRATASITVRTPTEFVGVGATGGAWRTAHLAVESAAVGPGVIASAATILDIASGRANVPSLYAAGEVEVTDLTGLLALAPIIEGVPGIPASAALARAARVMSGIGGALGSLGSLFGRR